MTNRLKSLLSFFLILNFISPTQAVPKVRTNISQKIAAPIKTAPKAPPITPKPAQKPIISTITAPKPQTDDRSDGTIPFSQRKVTLPAKPTIYSSNKSFTNHGQQPQSSTLITRNQENTSGIVVVPIYVPVITQQVNQPDYNTQNSDQNQSNNSTPPAQDTYSDQTTSTSVQFQSAPQEDDQSINQSISFPPTLNCPTMPTNNDAISMDYFKQENFNTDFIQIPVKANTKCDDQCKTEVPSKCYTGFTANNKCECATPKKNK